MTAPALIERRPRCHPGFHVHEQPPTGGRCAYYSPGRPGDICGRTPVAVYVNESAPVRNTYRCADHDKGVAQAEAARQGFVRREVRS